MLTLLIYAEICFVTTQFFRNCLRMATRAYSKFHDQARARKFEHALKKNWMYTRLFHRLVPLACERI